MTQSQSTDDLVRRYWWANEVFQREDGVIVRWKRGVATSSKHEEAFVRVYLAEDYERLQRELKGAKINCKAHAKRAEDAGRELAARDKTIETLREDAERYRWLRRRIQVTAIHCRDEPIRMLPADIVRQSPESYATEVDAMIDKCAARSEVKL